MADVDLPGLLAAHPLFASLTPAERAAVAARFVPRRYRRGATIFNEGDTATALHLIAEGTVRVVKRSPNGREQTLLFADPGETFAEVPAFDRGPDPAGAEAFTDALVYALPIGDFHRLLRTTPALAERALAILADRNRHLTEIVENLAFRPVIGRVAGALLSDSHMQTQTQMAATVGAAREMVNRSLHTLEREGVIASTAGRITIRDRDRLAEIATDV